MFKRLFPRRRSVDAPPVHRFDGLPPRPEESLVVVGDIHGQLKCLDAMIDMLMEKAPSARWVFVGDFVDRGSRAPRFWSGCAALKRPAQIRFSSWATTKK